MSDVNIQTFSGKVNVSNNFTVGSGHLFVDTQDNKVGLNTATPNSSLHVNGNAYVATDISFGGILSGNGSGLTSVNSDSGLWAGVGTGNVYLSTSTDNVGIGTSSPNEKLEIYATGMRIHDPAASPKIDLIRGGSSRNPNTDTFGASDYVDWRITSGPKLKFQQQYTGANSGQLLDVMTLEHSTGNVGIGTDVPGAKLTIGSTSSLLFADNRGISTARNWAVRVNNTNEGDFQIGNDGSNTGGLPNFYSNPTQAKLTINRDGNVGIGTTSPGAKLHVNGGELRVTNVDSATAEISAYGTTQGTGRLYVGQSTTYGGGIEYNGDNNPVTSGAGADYIALYRRNNGTNDWTARNFYNNNDWEFRGTVKTPILNVNGTTMSKAPRVIHIDDNRSGCPPAQAANTPIMQYSLTLSRTAYVYVSVTTILNYTSRADCHIYFGNTLQQAHLTAQDNTSWNPVNITAGGTLGAGTHNIVFRCSTANVVGCQGDWGGMQILVFET